MDIQFHLIKRLVDDVAYTTGTLHNRCMFFLEWSMKVLKGYVRQRARTEGNMAIGWLVQESMFYNSEFIGQMNALVPRIWTRKAVILGL